MPAGDLPSTSGRFLHAEPRFRRGGSEDVSPPPDFPAGFRREFSGLGAHVRRFVGFGVDEFDRSKMRKGSGTLIDISVSINMILAPMAISESKMPERGVRTPRTALPIPSPGEIFDPVARALEVIGDRWSLVLVRQLLLGPKGFQELRVRTGIAPRVLSGRLRQLSSAGFVESIKKEGRSQYAVSDRGRSLEPLIASIARWWVRDGIDDLAVDTGRFRATSAQSIVESLPFLLREDRLASARVVFEIRLTGEGGGVWTVEIQDGSCRVSNDFADHADVRYTAEARAWCAVALGMMDARDAIKRGLMTKDGAPEAMDHYFYQIARRDLDQSQAKPDARESAGAVRRKKDGRSSIGASRRNQE